MTLNNDTARRLGALVCLIAGSTSCHLIGGAGELDFDVSPNAKAEGSCMCAVCWTQPFCWRPSTPNDPWYLPFGGSYCDVDDYLAEPSSRVTGVTSRETGFYCVTPLNKSTHVSSTSNQCPASDDVRRQVEHIDACVDAEPCARPPECHSENENPCLEKAPDPRPEVCVEGGPEDAVEALVGACNLHGAVAPPIDEPARYCFLACVSPHTCTIDNVPTPTCHGCGVGEPQAQAASVFPVVVSAASSSVEVYIKDEEDVFQPIGTLAVEGVFRLGIPELCQGSPNEGGACEAAVLKSVSLSSVGSITVEDETITNVRMVDNAPVAGTAVTEGIQGTLSIPESSGFGVTAELTSHPVAFNTFTPEEEVVFDIGWSAGTVDTTMQLVSTDGKILIVFNLAGSFASLPPVAVATAAYPVLECGDDPIGLDAAFSYDPDGANDLVGFDWTADLGDTGLWTAAGVAPVLWHRKPGRYRFYLTVTDTFSSRGIDFVDVELIDSLPPVLDVGPDVYVEACAPTALPFLDIDLDDDCDTEPTLDIRIVEVNGVPTDLPYTPSETRLPLGKTILEYTARDEADNVAVGQHAVYLERGAACCPIGSTQIFGTSGNDVLNGLASGSSCLVGLDGQDSMNGGGSVVSFFAGRGNDTIVDASGKLDFAWGGLGHDSFYIDGNYQPGEAIVSGGADNDVVIYSADRPVRIRGGAGLDDLNSTTSQVTTFVVGAACEAVPGEFWQSYGPTVVESPISIEALVERGLTLALGEPVTYVPIAELEDADCY